MSEESGKGESGAAVAAPAKTKPKEKAKPAPPTQKPKFLPPYAVVVLNDDDHTYEYVIDTLCRVCGHSTEKAFKLAQEIDKTGRAVVWTGSMEVAELKRDQIKGRGPDFYARKPVNYPLGVHIEPMPQ
jgi:ATP-dependent Clp protease adaptor protein ClpS